MLPIRVPPWRERTGDIAPLVEHFLRTLGVEPVQLSRACHERLQSWQWPGTVRELKNTIERTLLLGRFPLDACQGPVSVADTEQVAGGTPGGASSQAGYPLDWPLEAVEHAHMRAVLASTVNNKSAAARMLGVSRNTLERKQARWNAKAAGLGPASDREIAKGRRLVGR